MSLGRVPGPCCFSSRELPFEVVEELVGHIVCEATFHDDAKRGEVLPVLRECVGGAAASRSHGSRSIHESMPAFGSHRPRRRARRCIPATETGDNGRPSGSMNNAQGPVAAGTVPSRSLIL